MQYNNRQEG